jgi:hypothetical protein
VSGCRGEHRIIAHPVVHGDLAIAGHHDSHRDAMLVHVGQDLVDIFVDVHAAAEVAVSVNDPYRGTHLRYPDLRDGVRAVSTASPPGSALARWRSISFSGIDLAPPQIGGAP